MSLLLLVCCCCCPLISYAITQGYAWKPQEWLNEPSLVALLSSPELTSRCCCCCCYTAAVRELLNEPSLMALLSAPKLHTPLTSLLLFVCLFCCCSTLMPTSYAITQGYAWKPQEWLNEPSLVALLSSPELHTLLLLHAAAGVQHVQNLRAAKQQQQQQGSKAQDDSEDSASLLSSEDSSSRDEESEDKQQQQQQQGWREVPAWHEQVFRACGLPAGVDLTAVFVLWGEESPSMSSVQVLGLALQLIGGGFWNKVRGFWACRWYGVITPMAAAAAVCKCCRCLCMTHPLAPSAAGCSASIRCLCMPLHKQQLEMRLQLLLKLYTLCCWLQRFNQMSTTGGLLRVKEEAQQRRQQQQQQQQRRPGPFGAIGALPDAAFLADPELRSALLLLLIQQLLLAPHIKRAVINLKFASQLASKVRSCLCSKQDVMLHFKL
jgi:hypothetical protein